MRANPTRVPQRLKTKMGRNNASRSKPTLRDVARGRKKYVSRGGEDFEELSLCWCGVNSVTYSAMHHIIHRSSIVCIRTANGPKFTKDTSNEQTNGFKKATTGMKTALYCEASEGGVISGSRGTVRNTLYIE